jgi:hypothetical protein
MIIYNKNKKTILGYLIVFFVIIIVFIPKDKENYETVLWNYYEKIASNDIGSSSIHELFEGSMRDPNNYINFFKKTPKIFKNIIFGVERESELSVLYIDIKFKNLQKLLEDRENAFNKRFGTDYRKVNAEITFNGEKIKSKIRLKGKLSDHWRSKHRMSFRVEIKGDYSVLGFKEFSLHKPSARQHPYDQTFQELQKNLNNISPSHGYVNLFVNGENWGIMNIEEHLTKELLEKQKFKESIIIEFGNEKHDGYKRTVKNLYDGYRISDPYINVNVLHNKKYLNNMLYRKYFSYISNQNVLKINNLYDNDSFSKSLILSLIWNNTHGLSYKNSKYYFNPYNLKLYPITTDQLFFSDIKGKLELPKPYEKIILTNAFKENFEENFALVKNAILNSQEIINKWQKVFPLDQKISFKSLIENQKLIEGDLYSVMKMDEVSDDTFQFNGINEEQAKSLMSHIFAKHYENGEIHIYNLTREKVRIKNIKTDSINLLDFNDIIIEGKSPLDYKPQIIYTDLKGIYDNKIEITTRISNDKNLRTHKLDYTLFVDDINNPLREHTNINKLNFFEKIDDNNYKIKKGKWIIKDPISISKNLTIVKGTELMFEDNSYLIVKGNLKILGDENQKVVLRSADQSWKGIYVYEGGGQSIINHAKISDVSFLKDGILELTGGVSFYMSDVKISNTSFINSNAEDFLNIIHSNFTLDNVSFSNSTSDAFDSDFSKGIIQNSFFDNITGDALDFSGSEVKIENTIFKNIQDKAISAGEESFLKINNIDADFIGVGVASKDASTVDIKNSSFSNYKLFALMTYKKKAFYDYPVMNGIGLKFDENNTSFIRQVNSYMQINGNIVKENEIDVDNLYENEIMKK